MYRKKWCTLSKLQELAKSKIKRNALNKNCVQTSEKTKRHLRVLVHLLIHSHKHINQGIQCFEQKFSTNRYKTKMTFLRSCTPSDILQRTWAGRKYWCLKQKLSTINEKIKWHQFMHCIPMNMSPGGGGGLWFKQKICRKMKEKKNGIFIYLHILAIKRERVRGEVPIK